uniref:Uncharacterized protein n=1 Tax=Blidingia minima TaxID=63414 RepID=A0A8E5J7F7_9CHLO|nr:hypothetical protein [Blidingia minima]
MRNFLESNFNELLINHSNFSRTPFKYGRLRSITESILFIDEYRSHLFPETAPILNTTDGIINVIDGKYLVGEETTFSGHPVFTTQESIQDTDYSFNNQEAFKSCFHQSLFQVNSEQSKNEIINILDNLTPDYCFSFGIFVNAMYVKYKFSAISVVPQHWQRFSGTEYNSMII